MIAPLRRRHFWLIVALLLIVPPLVVAALQARPPWPNESGWSAPATEPGR